MSQILVQEVKQEQQLKASQILRQTTVTQIKHAYAIPGNRFCAIGALMNYFGWSGCGGFGYNDIGLKKLGINDDMWGQIIHLNDDGKSFIEIADWLEANGL